MAKVFGNLKQIVNLVRVIRVFGTDLEQLVIGSFPFHPFLRRSFSNTQSINMIISDYLLFPNSTEVLLHGRLGSIHPGFESTMKSLNHVPLQIREDFTFLWSSIVSRVVVGFEAKG